MHKAKKNFGQNFLKSDNILKKIVLFSEITENDYCLEIGPGKGALTEKILEVNKNLIVIEKDKDLIPILNDKFAVFIENNKIKIEEKDILNFDEVSYFNKKKYSVIGNIPYNITGAIIKKFLSSENKPINITFLVQKEVANRIAAVDKKESILSISVKIFGDPFLGEKVPKRYFSPEPKVDSRVIKIKNIKNPFKNNKEEEFFFNIVKTGFSKKRKMLISNLKDVFSELVLEDVFDKIKLDKKIRAENLNVEKWITLVEKLSTS